MATKKKMSANKLRCCLLNFTNTHNTPNKRIMFRIVINQLLRGSSDTYASLKTMRQLKNLIAVTVEGPGKRKLAETTRLPWKIFNRMTFNKLLTDDLKNFNSRVSSICSTVLRWRCQNVASPNFGCFDNRRPVGREPSRSSRQTRKDFSRPPSPAGGQSQVRTDRCRVFARPTLFVFSPWESRSQAINDTSLLRVGLVSQVLTRQRDKIATDTLALGVCPHVVQLRESCDFQETGKRGFVAGNYREL